MLDHLAQLPGDHLDLDAYNTDFDHHFEGLTDVDALKVERLQTFHQPESASWMTYRAGNVAESLHMLDHDRHTLLEAFNDLAARGSQVRRVRVVQWPITPYLHWELHSLHVRAQCGEHTRIVGADALAHLEIEHIVPEVVTLGEQVTYRIRYTDQGVLEGAVRYLEPRLTNACAAQIHALYEQAEPLTDFFAREITPYTWWR